MATLVEELIEHLSAEEATSAEAWLASPLHNRRPVLLDLYHHLQQRFLKKPNDIWERLFPERTFDLASWDLLKSDLLQVLEAWLSYRQWKGFGLPQVVRPSLVEAYRNRGLHRHLENRLKRAERALKKRPSPALPEVFRLHAAFEPLPALEPSATALDFALVRTKLQAACQTISSLRLKSQALEIPLLRECLDLAAQPPYCDRPGIAPYSLACLLLLEPNQAEQHFEQLRDQWLSQLDYYPREEQRDLLRIVLNYCVSKINAGIQHYLQPTLDLYRMALDLELVYEGGYISPFTFDNILGIALRLGEDDWAESFLQREAPQLPQELQAPLLALNLARLALERLDFDGVLLALRESDFRDFIHQLSARTLQLKAYRALGFNELSRTHLQNTRALLRRKRTTSYHVTNYRNIFELANQLMRLQPGDERAKKRLRHQILETEPLTERAWLLGQLD